MMNPTDIFSIVRKLSTKEYQVAREAYVAARRFLHRLLEEFCTANAELLKFVNPTDPFPERLTLPCLKTELTGKEVPPLIQYLDWFTKIQSINDPSSFSLLIKSEDSPA
ncbi:hypothetical protein L1887_28157 [Cichorium endivia]|nr:hypothetical protein L1887_28157 [Cichorium endivia]